MMEGRCFTYPFHRRLLYLFGPHGIWIAGYMLLLDQLQYDTGYIPLIALALVVAAICLLWDRLFFEVPVSVGVEGEVISLRRFYVYSILRVQDIAGMETDVARPLWDPLVRWTRVTYRKGDSVCRFYISPYINAHEDLLRVLSDLGPGPGRPGAPQGFRCFSLPTKALLFLICAVVLPPLVAVVDVLGLKGELMSSMIFDLFVVAIGAAMAFLLVRFVAAKIEFDDDHVACTSILGAKTLINRAEIASVEPNLRFPSVLFGLEGTLMRLRTGRSVWILPHFEDYAELVESLKGTHMEKR